MKLRRVCHRPGIGDFRPDGFQIDGAYFGGWFASGWESFPGMITESGAVRRALSKKEGTVTCPLEI